MAEMDLDDIVDKAQSLSDLELATLICLVAEKHCLIETERHLVDDVAVELALVRMCQCPYRRPIADSFCNRLHLMSST
jgi:hypothetical protein